MIDADNILAAHKLTKAYGRGDARVDAVRGVDLNVGRGEFVAVMGPSGCGKTTLLNLLGLISPADSGTLTVDGHAIGPGRRRRDRLRRDVFGFVFQRFNLLGTLNAADNITISLRLRGKAPGDEATRWMDRLDILDVAGRKPSQMSIGQQQRVAVARALAHGPKVLLADEPTGSLDSANAASLLALLRQINRDQGQTIVMITHSSEAAETADRIVQMKDGRLLDPTC